MRKRWNSEIWKLEELGKDDWLRRKKKVRPCEEDSEVTETTSSSETVDSEGESGTAGVGAGDGSGTTTETGRRDRRNRIQIERDETNPRHEYTSGSRDRAT